MTVHFIDFSEVDRNKSRLLNPIGSTLRCFILKKLKVALDSPDVDSIILLGGSHHFSVGADLTEFASASSITESSTTLIEVVNALEASTKPVIAAVRGKALGGGMEVAIACHYRITTSTATWALPEVKVGLIPGAGGTQRLGRLIGMKDALDMILSGKSISGSKAFDIGLADAVVDERQGEDLLQVAQKWAGWAQLMPLQDRRTGLLPLKEAPTEVQALCRAAREKLPPVEVGGEAVHCAIQALEACSTSASLEEGLQVEEEMVMTCLLSSQGMARRHVFFAIRQAQKPIHPPPNQHPLLEPKPKCAVAVIGAGTMGGGIAMVLLRTGYPKVYLVDVNSQALERGVTFLTKAIHNLVKKQKITTIQAEKMQKAFLPTTNLNDLTDCLLVVEAVVENMKVKKQIFQTLHSVAPSNALLLSNTSTLSIDEMASILPPSRQSSFAGWHFFSPAHVMQLVEIVVGKNTSPTDVGLLQALTKKIGKIGVVVGNCDGFVGNRMVRPYGAESLAVIVEGLATVEQLDAALQTVHGMALGPMMMADLAGNDVGYNIRRERGWVRDPATGVVEKNRPQRYSELADDLVVKLGRNGQKSGKGWYDYDPRIGRGYKPIPSKEVAEFVRHYIVGPKPNSPLANADIIRRVLFALVNEGFKCLEDGVALRPSDIDVIYIFGYGFPPWRGGPMYWADHEVGLENLLKDLQEFSQQYPGTEHFVPSRLLEECVSLHVTVEDYYRRGLYKKKGNHTFGYSETLSKL